MRLRTRRGQSRGNGYSTPVELEPDEERRFPELAAALASGRASFDTYVRARFLAEERFNPGDPDGRALWTEEAVCLAEHFVRQEDGSYRGTAGGSPIWLRCVCVHEDYFLHVDGGRRLYYYRLLSVNVDGTIDLPEGGILHP